ARASIKVQQNRFLLFSPDNAKLATVSYSLSGPFTVRLWDVARAEELKALHGSDPLAFSPDGQALAMAGEDRAEIVLWNIPTEERRRIRPGHAVLCCLAFSPDGRVLASGGANRRARTRGGESVEAVGHTIKLWDASTGEQLGAVEGHTVRIDRLAFSP